MLKPINPGVILKALHVSRKLDLILNLAYDYDLSNIETFWLGISFMNVQFLYYQYLGYYLISHLEYASYLGILYN